MITTSTRPILVNNVHNCRIDLLQVLWFKVKCVSRKSGAGPAGRFFSPDAWPNQLPSYWHWFFFSICCSQRRDANVLKERSVKWMTFVRDNWEDMIGSSRHIICHRHPPLKLRMWNFDVDPHCGPNCSTKNLKYVIGTRITRNCDSTWLPFMFWGVLHVLRHKGNWKYQEPK